MVQTRSHANQDPEEPMDIDDDDLDVLSSPALAEILMLSSAGRDIRLPEFFSGSLGEAVDAALNSHPEGGRKRLLLLFLFSDGSEASGEFVRDVICHKEFRNIVGEVGSCGSGCEGGEGQ
eukprot:TRINITY_DN33040_c0_g1_i1.p1 TRINITY_DN33040_c0_g1~~TRINITY_DN33040_c0_g1_i1.p1  ORF type:complete len:120 (-),score=30.51 TRINITY_DN33040_c0_g1_i1:49-408(-)